MSLTSDTRVSDRRNLTQILSPEVALDLVLRSHPSTPAIEEARRISLARQAAVASKAMTDSLALHPTTERSSERAIRKAGYADARPSLARGANVRTERSGYRSASGPGLPATGTSRPVRATRFVTFDVLAPDSPGDTLGRVGTPATNRIGADTGAFGQRASRW